MNKIALMAEMQEEIAVQLVEIEETLQRWNLRSIDGITLIARSRSNDEMIVVITNEDAPGLQRACQLALLNQSRHMQKVGRR